MTERSGLDILEEILQRLDRIEQQLRVQDQNLKRIANSAKIADLVTRASNTLLGDFTRANKSIGDEVKKEIDRVKNETQEKMRFNFESSDAAKQGGAPDSRRRGARAVAAAPPNKPSTIMCKGKMLVQNGEETVPIPGLAVKIFDAKDQLVKETKTNRAGHWMSQLPPGQYVVSYEGDFKGQALVPINKNFEVPSSLPKGQSFVEVA